MDGTRARTHRPPLTVALGATAARSLVGKIVTISKVRGAPLTLADGSLCWVTIHPSFLLRLPDEEARRTERAAFVDDLKRIRDHGDPVEAVWKTYYASIFNPARVKVKAMTKEMPKKYWKNMPETALIGELLAGAQKREAAMIETSRSQEPVQRSNLTASWEALKAEAARCTRCDLINAPRRRCSAKARSTRPSCSSASSRATRRILPGAPSSALLDKCSTLCWPRRGSTAPQRT